MLIFFFLEQIMVGFFFVLYTGFPNKNGFEKPQLQRLQITCSNTAGTGTFPEHNHLSLANSQCDEGPLFPVGSDRSVVKNVIS